MDWWAGPRGAVRELGSGAPVFWSATAISGDPQSTAAFLCTGFSKSLDECPFYIFLFQVKGGVQKDLLRQMRCLGKKGLGWSHLTHTRAIFHALPWMCCIQQRKQFEATVEGRKISVAYSGQNHIKWRSWAPQKVNVLSHQSGSMPQAELEGVFPEEDMASHNNKSDYVFPATESEASKRGRTGSPRIWECPHAARLVIPPGQNSLIIIMNMGGCLLLAILFTNF